MRKILETQPSEKSCSHCWNALKGIDGTLSTSSSSLWSTSHEVNSFTLPHTSSMVHCLTSGPDSTWTIDHELKALKPRTQVSHVSSEWPDYLRCVIKIEADEHSCAKWKIHPWCREMVMLPLLSRVHLFFAYLGCQSHGLPWSCLTQRSCSFVHILPLALSVCVRACTHVCIVIMKNKEDYVKLKGGQASQYFF